MGTILKSVVTCALSEREPFVVLLKLLVFLTIYARDVQGVSWNAISSKTPTSASLYNFRSVKGNQTDKFNEINDIKISKSNLTGRLLATTQNPRSNTEKFLAITGKISKQKSKTLNRSLIKTAETRIRRRRVVGGNTANPNEFAFQVLLLRQGKVYCGGTILNENHILTAAKCFDDIDNYQYDAEELASWTIVAGDHNWKIDEGPEQRRHIRDIYIHIRYRPVFEVNNIAIIKLDRPLQLTAAVQPILLPHADYEARGDAILTGWGKLRYRGSNPLVLQKVTLPIVDRANCVKLYEDEQVHVSVKMMCAGNVVAGGVDACQGDLGGPLSVKLSNGSFMLIGIVSGGIKCGMAEFPGIYTQVSKYVDWISFTLTNFDSLTENCRTLDSCKNGGTCVDAIDSFRCTCAYGFSGFYCEHIEIDKCLGAKPCQNGGTCADGRNSFTCACADGFAGIVCQHANKCRYPGACGTPTDAGNCHRCRDGFVVDPEDNTTCKYANEKPTLIISSQDSTIMISPDEKDNNQEIQNGDHVLGIDVKVQTNTIVWFSDSSKTIYTAPLKSASGEQRIAHDSSFEILGLAVDWIHNHIYWVDSGKKELCVSSFSGTMNKVLINEGLKSPHSIAVNPLNGWMYWTDEGKNHIERAGMDGSRREVILSTDIKEPQSIVVDFESNRLYWSQGWYTSSIWSSDFDGSDRKLIFHANPSQFRTSYFFKVVTFEDNVYFIEYYSKTIYKLNKCNGEGLGIVYQSNSRLWDVKIHDFNLQPEGDNWCAKRIGRCSHFCFPVPAPGIDNISTTTCGCPDGLSLSTDKANCV